MWIYYYYNKKARVLPPLEEDVMCMRPWMGRHLRRSQCPRDLMNGLTKSPELIFERHKKRTNLISSQDMEPTQEMTTRNLTPHVSRPLHHQSTTINLIPHDSQPQHHLSRNKPPNQASVPTETRPKRAVREPAYLKDHIRKKTLTLPTRMLPKWGMGNGE